MGNYGIKMSLPGVDVKTASLNELILYSKYPFQKFLEVGSGSTSLTDGGAGFDVLIKTHSLGYIPRVEIFSTYYDPIAGAMISDYEPMPKAQISSGGAIYMDYKITADTSVVRFAGATLGGDTASHTINYFYIIYYDEA